MHTLYGETMGTRWRVDLLAAGAALHALHAAVQAELDAVVAEMSDWDPRSDVSRYGRAAAGSWRVLPEACFTVLQQALAVAEASDGAFDPTIAPLVEAWGFGARGDGGRVPSAAVLASARSRVGWRRVVLDAASRGVLQPGGLQLDLSAIAKGHGVDAVVARLRAMGIAAALVDVGGEVRGYGRKPDGGAWRVLVDAMPDDALAPVVVLRLDDRAAATSGDGWHRFDADGRRYPHTLDARTGAPVAHRTRAVTVVDATAMGADAWATALLVMGSEAGHAVAQARGLAARFVDDADDDSIGGGRHRVRTTTAFDAVCA
ncbi:MAG TPA: FAD:protein FMN transferase [Luteimonas sp.]|nr:FAD:protein FMN transferase [Luteimonas sp.]